LTFDAGGRDQVVTVEFHVSTNARISEYVLDFDSRRIDQLRTDVRLEAGTYRSQWRGVISGRPVSPASYRYVVEARDDLGHTRSVDTEIVVPPYRFPVGRIMRAELGPRVGQVGQPLTVRVRVRNNGLVPLRGIGQSSLPLPTGAEGVPQPLGESESTWGSWRVAVGLADGDRAGNREFWRPGGGSTNPTLPLAQRYPFRWGLGRTLAPGEEVEVTGQIELPTQPGRWWVYTGLIHEGFVVHDDGIFGQLVEVRP
jgi:hypothetical protein